MGEGGGPKSVSLVPRATSAKMVSRVLDAVPAVAVSVTMVILLVLASSASKDVAAAASATSAGVVADVRCIATASDVRMTSDVSACGSAGSTYGRPPRVNGVVPNPSTVGRVAWASAALAALHSDNNPKTSFVRQGRVGKRKTAACDPPARDDNTVTQRSRIRISRLRTSLLPRPGASYIAYLASHVNVGTTPPGNGRCRHGLDQSAALGPTLGKAGGSFSPLCTSHPVIDGPFTPGPSVRPTQVAGYSATEQFDYGD